MYKVLYEGRIIESDLPGKYAGWAPGKIFGRLDCKSGMRMKKENRVFFLTLEDAVNQGYRPCRNCKPISEAEFEIIREVIPQYSCLSDFYHGKKRIA